MITHLSNFLLQEESEVIEISSLYFEINLGATHKIMSTYIKNSSMFWVEYMQIKAYISFLFLELMNVLIHIDGKMLDDNELFKTFRIHTLGYMRLQFVRGEKIISWPVYFLKILKYNLKHIIMGANNYLESDKPQKINVSCSCC